MMNSVRAWSTGLETLEKMCRCVVELRDICAISIEEIDVSTTSFTIRKIKPKNIGEVVRRVKNHLKEHGFQESATLTRTKTVETL